MNQKKRKQILDIIEDVVILSRELQAIQSNVIGLHADEQAKLENIPENLEGSARYNDLEASSDALDEAASEIESAYVSISEALSHLMNTGNALEDSL